MGEKRKRRWFSRRKRGATAGVERERAVQPATTDAAPIRKGIYLSALIYVEGEQPPAQNFDPVAIGALEERLASALKGDKGGLSMELKGIEARNDIEQDDEGESKEERFQF